MEGYYKVSLRNGSMTIIKSDDPQKAEEWAEREYGRFLEPRLSEASEEDVAWVKSWNGKIHNA
jgi:hypothetical protein